MAVDSYANGHSHGSSPQPKDEPPDDQLLALKEEDVDDEEGEYGESEEEAGEEDDQLQADDDALGAARFWRIGQEDRVQNQKIVERNVGELYHMMRTGRLNFTPDYQRDEVWTKARKQGLLDSLFKGCPVPAIVLAQKRRADGREYFNVIDGKQRLTTILAFMSGKLTYKNKLSTTNKDFCYHRASGTPSSYLIPQADKDYFDERIIVCVEHYDLPTAQEEDIFKRIQQGMTLVTGEKSSVGNAPRQLFVKELIKEYLAPGSVIPAKIDLDTKRGRNFINLASFVQICSHLPRDSISPTAASREKWVSQPDVDVDDEVKIRCRGALDEFIRLVEEYPDPFKRMSQRVAPVEFQFIALYLYITLDVPIPMQVRAQELLEMRVQVHKAFPNTVKANSTVYGFLWKQLSHTALREENGYEPMALMPDVSNIGGKTKAKGKAKAKITATVGSEDEIAMSLDDETTHHGLVSPKKRARPLVDADNSPASASPRPKATPKAKKMRM